MTETIRHLAWSLLTLVGVDKRKFHEKLGMWSVGMAVAEKGYGELIKKLREIQPDLSEQYSSGKEAYNDYAEFKLRGMHAFQCSLMLGLLDSLPEGTLTVVDIGDSAGTHMKYLQGLTQGRYDIDAISINLDPRAVEKIKAKGQKALLCRAEELDLGADRSVDLFTSFEMVEHLHNPAIFFRRLSKRSRCSRMLITVPYRRESRVGLHNVRNGATGKVYAEDEHVFELNPRDWSLLLLHSGWGVVREEIYLQYPARLPVIGRALAWYWRNSDFEGFWGAVLEKDTAFADRYMDWED